MRNIKTTLRFVRNSALLFAAASGMTYLTGCQSENVVSPENPVVPEASLSTASYSVYGPNQSRVTNYGTRGTRQGEYVEAAKSFTMDEFLTTPTDVQVMTANDQWALNGNVVVKGKETRQGIGFSGPTNIFVEGEFHVNNIALNDANLKGKINIFVQEGGLLDFMGGTLNSGINIYCKGDLEFSAATLVGDGNIIKSDSSIECTGNFETNTNSELYCRGSLTCDANVRLNGKAIACAFIADKGEVKFNDNGTVLTSYIKGKTVWFAAGKVELDNNGLVEAEELSLSNVDTEFTVRGTNAVVAAKKFVTNNLTWPKKQFAKEIALDFEKCYIKTAETPKSDFEWQVSADNQVVWVPAAGCHGSYGKAPENNPGGNENTGGDEGDGNEETETPPTVTVPTDPDEPITTPELVKVTDIKGLDDEVNGNDHEHGIISATCINFGSDGTAYASYHLRGNGKNADKNENYLGEYAQKGCIEVIKDNGEAGMELGSYMIAPDWDFNHLIVDGNNIITVGNSKMKDAFIASLPTNFEASNGVRDDMKVRELTTNEPLYGPSKEDPNKEIKIGYKNAGDGNCVVRQGNYYYVATYGGYGPLNLDFSKVLNSNGDKIFTKTNGSCKHISINGGNMAVIALDSYDKTRSTASVYTFGASDYSFANVLASYNAIGTVEPVDGKNVLAVDGDEIYACLSKGGLVRVSDGKKWQRGKNGNVPVNGMAFDEKYIYVANGSFVSVLDKATMNEICYYHAASQKSANYIALRNGKIYVAFGEDGIQVFQLVEKEIAQN